MPRISKTTRLLNHDPDLSDAHEAVYVTPTDDDGDHPTGGTHTTTVRVPLLDWEDLGRPTTITVTIEPGDHLNGPDA